MQDVFFQEVILISDCLESIRSCLDLVLKAERKWEYFILRLFSYFSFDVELGKS